MVGVGLNVTLREPELPVPTAISLGLADAKTTDRDTVLRACLRGIAAEYAAWLEVGGDPEFSLLPAYRQLCATIGRGVRVELPGGRVLQGRAGGVDAAGSLVVEVRDSSSNALLGRAVDNRVVGYGAPFRRDSVTNRADFERVFGGWAKSSVEGLAELKARSPLGGATTAAANQ